jgi:antitoxin FitA
MATLNIRNLSNTVHAQLRVRAAKNGRSMEAEARAILSEACANKRALTWDPSTLQAFFDRLYGKKRPRSATDDLISERRREAAQE